MTCNFCTAPLPIKGIVCEYCGKRNPLNLKTLSNIEIKETKSALKCPTCHTDTDNLNIGLKQRIMIQRCNDCDGLFLTTDISEELIKAHTTIKKEIDLQILQFVKNNPRSQKETVIRYKKCPICDSLMHRLNYRSVSGVIVDKCYKHGVWLDTGELLQLFEWKQATRDTQESFDDKPEVAKGDKSFTRPHKESNDSYFDPIGDFFKWLQG